MVTGQGLESMWLQHKECHDQLWAGLAELGLEPYGARCCCTHETAAVTAAYNAARCLSAFHFSGSSFCVHGSSRSVMLYETVPCAYRQHRVCLAVANPDERLVTINTIKVLPFLRRCLRSRAQ